MAITRKSVNKQNSSVTAGNAPTGVADSAVQDTPLVTPCGGGELTIAPRPFLLSRFLKNPLKRLKKDSEELVVTAAEEELRHPAQEVPPLRPSDLQKAGYVSPAYTMSRAVKLAPQTMAVNRCVGFNPAAPETDFYRMLRTQILQRADGNKGITVMVTSSLAGEGKTLTAINLAFTFAREYKQTSLLVDCDLRRQQVHEVLGFPSDKGIVDYLIDDCPIPQLFVWPGVDKMTVISGGKTVQDSSELLGSPGMQRLVEEMKNRYPERCVFFDVPAVLTSADALAFAPFVDYIVVVVRAGFTPLPDVNRALKLLPHEKLLGLVMNRQQNILKPVKNGRLRAS